MMAKKLSTTPETTEATDVMAASVVSVSRNNKKALLISMLSCDSGTTIAAISAALGWQPHTTRAAITGLRKTGHKIETGKQADGSSRLIYRIAIKSDALTKVKNGTEARQ